MHQATFESIQSYRGSGRRSHCPYCSLLTSSIHSTDFPSSDSAIAIRLMPTVVGLAPCQCLTPGGIHTTSPGQISWTESPHFCTRPTSAVTMSVRPSGCACSLPITYPAIRSLALRRPLRPGASASGICQRTGLISTRLRRCLPGLRSFAQGRQAHGQ